MGKSEKVRVSNSRGYGACLRKMKISDEKVREFEVFGSYFVKKSVVEISEAWNSLRFCRFLP